VLQTIDGLLGLAMLGAVASGKFWLVGMIDGKNDGLKLTRKLVDAAVKRLSHSKGLERHELVSAAHTVLVVTSFFEALRDALGPVYNTLDLKAQEMLSLASADRAKVVHGEYDVNRLLDRQCPEPWRGVGLEQAIRDDIEPLYHQMALRCLGFLDGLQAWCQAVARERVGPFDTDALVTSAAWKYRGYYHRLAAEVPEFGLWVLIGESHAAGVRIDKRLEQVAAQHSAGLSKLERLIESLPGANGRPRREGSGLDLLSRHNRAFLDSEIVQANTLRIASFLRLPSVRQSYVTPRFRYASYDPNSHPAHEDWWDKQCESGDLDTFLAAHMLSPNSARTPMVVLGHPGAGKSLLGKVLAARLPDDVFAAVWVPLRHVDPGVPIYQQIDQALAAQLAGRLDWARLCEETGAGKIVLVVLDGLDELIQASGVSQSRYLLEAAEFQRTQYAHGHPVVIIATSRIVVADRVDIPPGALTIKLEDFDAHRIAQWSRTWNEVNATTADFRGLTAATLESVEELAAQPLLLVMIALYTADPKVPEIHSLRSSADLFQQLIDNFIRREIAKDAEVPGGRGIDVDAELSVRRWRLAIAAFAMFNRGRQHVSEPELQRDLELFLGAEQVNRTTFSEPIDRVTRTIGEFFFVHAPGGDSQLDARRGLHRTYEFLHATFGEYLIAAETVQVLLHMAGRRAADYHAHSPYREVVDDSRLRELISHQPLLKRASILKLAVETYDGLSADERRWIRAVLGDLIRGVRSRSDGEIVLRSNPTGADHVSRLSIYSLNLVCLLVEFEGGELELRQICPEGEDELAWWRSLVRLWQACVDAESWESLVRGFDVDPDRERPILLRVAGLGNFPHEVAAAQLVGDRRAEAWLWAGMRSWEGGNPRDRNDIEVHGFTMEFWDPRDFLSWSGCAVATQRRVLQALAHAAPRLSWDEVEPFAGLITGDIGSEDPVSVAMLAAFHPQLLERAWDAIERAREKPQLLQAAVILIGGSCLDTSDPERVSMGTLANTILERLAQRD
jgi:hypothetical protein